MCEAQDRSTSTLSQRKIATTTTTMTEGDNRPTAARRFNVYYYTDQVVSYFWGNQMTMIPSSRTADGILAAVGAGLCLGLLTFAAQTFKMPFMASFLIGATLKMFLNREPPSLVAFYKSSIFCIVMGTVMHYVLPNLGITKDYATPYVVTLSLLYWKLAPGAELWAPANNLALYLATAEPSWRLSGFLQNYPWYYLMTPYLTGHLWIYAFARLWSRLRRWVRAQLVSREFFVAHHHAQQSSLWQSSTTTSSHEQYEQQHQERLRELFDRMDLDHNGRLDVQELQLAFRKALECDLSLDEARMILKSADTDGDETLDFYEFRSAMMDRMPARKKKTRKNAIDAANTSKSD
eukprot:scaffold1112_cov92-Amphora_coffeaeformis.AAC.25